MGAVKPQFDFGANDTPTRDTLIQQALSLQVGEITDLLTNTLFLKIRSGDDSGTTGSDTSTAGEMWMSPGEQLFVNFGDGPVTVWTPDGWWESNRYVVRDDIFDEKKIGQGAYANPSVGTSENGIRWEINPDGFENASTNGTINVILNESAFSGNARVVGHGPCHLALEDNTRQNLGAALRPGSFRVIGNAPSAVFWYIPRNVPNHASNSSHNYRRFAGIGAGLVPQSSSYSAGNVNPGSIAIENALGGYFTGSVLGPGEVN